MIGEIELERPEAASSFEPLPWHGFSLLDKLIVIALPVLALLSALNVFSGLIGTYNWIVTGLLMLVWAGFLVFKRQQILNNEHQWVDAGCPNCQEYEMVRVSRHRWDRLYSWLQLPAYRYACRECTWRGLRIGRRHRRSYEYLVQDKYEVVAATDVGVYNAAASEQPASPSFEEELPSDEHVIATGAPLPNEESLNGNTTTAETADDGMEWLWERLSEEK